MNVIRFCFRSQEREPIRSESEETIDALLEYLAHVEARCEALRVKVEELRDLLKQKGDAR